MTDEVERQAEELFAHIDQLAIINEDEQRQRKRLDQVRHVRDQSAVDAAPSRPGRDGVRLSGASVLWVLRIAMPSHWVPGS